MRMTHDLLGQFCERVGFVEVPVGRVGDVGISYRPTSALDRCGIEYRPDRPRRKIGRPRTLIHGERSICGSRPLVLRLYLRGTRVAPIQRDERITGAIGT